MGVHGCEVLLIYGNCVLATREAYSLQSQVACCIVRMAVDFIGHAIFYAVKRVIGHPIAIVILDAFLRYARVSRLLLAWKVFLVTTSTSWCIDGYRLNILGSLFAHLFLRQFLQIVIFSLLKLVLALHKIVDFLYFPLLGALFLKLGKASRRLPIHVCWRGHALSMTESTLWGFTRWRLHGKLVEVARSDGWPLWSTTHGVTDSIRTPMASPLNYLGRPWILDINVNERGCVAVSVLRDARTDWAWATRCIFFVHLVERHLIQLYRCNQLLLLLLLQCYYYTLVTILL